MDHTQITAYILCLFVNTATNEIIVKNSKRKSSGWGELLLYLEGTDHGKW